LSGQASSTHAGPSGVSVQVRTVSALAHVLSPTEHLSIGPPAEPPAPGPADDDAPAPGPVPDPDAPLPSLEVAEGVESSQPSKPTPSVESKPSARSFVTRSHYASARIQFD